MDRLHRYLRHLAVPALPLRCVDRMVLLCAGVKLERCRRPDPLEGLPSIGARAQQLLACRCNATAQTNRREAGARSKVQVAFLRLSSTRKLLPWCDHFP
jgi:hypothetical protein